MENKFHLKGRVFIQFNVIAMTGLHIGGSSAGMEIGGVDNTVIRDPLTKSPYIPGSSLRGKMRSQLEKSLGLPQNNQVGQVKIHTCKTKDDYNENGGCPVCQIFGVPGEVDATGPTLLLARDVFMTKESQQKLIDAHTDLAFTELKTEATIDRVTSAATPRTIERVPAGAVFGPAELVFSIYEADDFNRLHYVIDGLQLIQDDYLGGYGSRGSGKVCFEQIRLSARSSKTYTNEIKYDKIFPSLNDLEKDYAAILTWAKANIPISNKE